MTSRADEKAEVLDLAERFPESFWARLVADHGVEFTVDRNLIIEAIGNLNGVDLRLRPYAGPAGYQRRMAVWAARDALNGLHELLRRVAP